jgi:aldose 1-epimerase
MKNNFFYLPATLIFCLALMACSPVKESAEDNMTLSGLNPSDFNRDINGKNTGLYILKNKNGMEACITNYGARLISLMTPDKDGKMGDVVLGFTRLDDYLEGQESYHGATIGRYGNRIANGSFSIDGESFQLAQNNGPNSLHGGPGGFHRVVWEVMDVQNNKLRLSYISEDGEEGFPGTLTTELEFVLSDENELVILYDARTDKKTIVNLTHHSYFNLKGEGNGDITDHHFQIFADEYTPVDSTLIPTGISGVENTPFDLRSPIELASRINLPDSQLKLGGGFDHNFVLRGAPEGQYGSRLAAIVTAPSSGRKLIVYTNEPGLQFYSGNFMDGSDIGKSGQTYSYRTGFCLETQHFPDSPNHPDFPSVILQPDEKYFSVCIYKFVVE